MKRLELLGILYWVFGGLNLAGALLFALVGVLGGLGIIEPGESLQERLTGVAGSAMLFVGAGGLGAAHFFVGSGLRRLRPGSRTAGMVLAVLDIICCCGAPLGTVLGIYALVVLLNDDVARLFSSS